MVETGDALAAKSQPRRGRHPQRQALAARSQPYAIAAYPHLKGDELAEQAQALANRAYEEAAQRLPGRMRELEFTIRRRAVTGSCICLQEGDGPFPTVLMCGGLDSLQIDHYSLYERYFAPKGIAMLTLDMPSIGFPLNGN